LLYDKLVNKRQTYYASENEYELFKEIDDTLSSSMYTLLRKSCAYNNETNLTFSKSYVNCVRWWAADMISAWRLAELEQEQLRWEPTSALLAAPLFMPNRLVPSVHLIRVHTDVDISADSRFNEHTLMRDAHRMLDDWWSQMSLKHGLNEQTVWWTSEHLSDYFYQKRLVRQLITSTLVPLFIMFLFCLYSTSGNLFVSVCFILTMAEILVNTIAVTVLFEWRLDTLSCLLYALSLVMAAHHMCPYAVSYRFSPHVNMQNSLFWSFNLLGSIQMALMILIVTSTTAFMLLTSSDMYKRMAIALLLSNGKLVFFSFYSYYVLGDFYIFQINSVLIILIVMIITFNIFLFIYL
jgi:hypothetical protein